MSPREKKLLLFFGAGAFVMLNLLAYGFFSSQREAVARKKVEARTQLEALQSFQARREEMEAGMEWIREHEPEPQNNQDVQTALQQLAETQARSAGLTIRTQKPLPSDTSGVHYHRAKLQITLTGPDEALYRWFDRINDPEQFRSATEIRLSPNTQDDTKIDAVVTIDQWFVPIID